MPDVLWTIGHSTRTIDEFVSLLKARDIQQLVDIRTIPRSRHNPQFNTETISRSLKKEGLLYEHMPQLGGLRKPKKDSINAGWRNASFRGYADYMQTEQFGRALDELMANSKERKTVIMCAEAVPWRCHRSLIADALVMRDWEIRHIMSEERADRHQLRSFARVKNGLIHYPDLNVGPQLFP
ncbi:MAG: DNA repair protein [Nitrospira sp. SG-bin1]|nr:MAG: DNA repair protein [Nitrospira sp. SG-bin1]